MRENWKTQQYNPSRAIGFGLHPADLESPLAVQKKWMRLALQSASARTLENGLNVDDLLALRMLTPTKLHARSGLLRGRMYYNGVLFFFI